MTDSHKQSDSQLDLVVVEDSDLDVEMLVDALHEAGVNIAIRRAGNEVAFRAAMEQKIPDAILADWTVPGFPGARALAVAHENYGKVPFLFVSGTISEASAFEALRRGAVDYVYKHQLEKLGPALLRAVLEARTQGTLIQSEERYRLLFEGFRDSLMLLAPPGWQCLEGNKASLQLFGAETLDQLQGLSLWDLSPDLQPDGSLSAHAGQIKLEIALREGHHQFEWQFRRLHGANFPAEIGLLRLDINGSVMMLAAVRDITERQQSSQNLFDSEERYRGLFESAKDGILILDGETGHITQANPFVSQMLGMKMNAMLGKSLWEVGLFPDRDQVELILEELREVGYVRRDDLHIPSKNGNAHEVIFISNRYRAGHSLVIQCNIRDITDRKIAERLAVKYQSEMMQSLHQIVAALVALNEARDPYTAGHEYRVSELAFAIAVELNLSAHQCEGIRITGLVHDIGKFTIPAEILTKPNRISTQELALLQTHAQAGYEALRQIKFPWPVAEAVWHHHERFDGTGYPQGLKGDQISLEGRILAVADTVESMASNRPYRVSPGLQAGLAAVETGMGSLYDPIVVGACLRLFREKNYSFPAAPGAF
jgi:PAS domain S-box-containing protein